MSCACRANKIEEAVTFAQTSLAPLRGLLTSRQGVSDAMLHEVVALLAYDNPMVRVPSQLVSRTLADHSPCLREFVCNRWSLRQSNRHLLKPRSMTKAS